MRLNSGFTDQVRNSVSIVEVVGQYVQLKKTGLNFQGLCPFHSEKDPSFTVNENKQMFYCFGCNVGGDVFKFVQLIENISYPEAIRLLAEKSGIPLPRSTGDTKSFEKKQRLLKVMSNTEQYFIDNLHASPMAREYLDKRHIHTETISTFGLGYALPGSRLMQHLEQKGYLRQDLIECGLVIKTDSGDSYDRFRNRIMFPIKDLSGRTIAFGGRIIGEGQPKYLNSPETPLYHKGSHLFGLHLGRSSIRDRDFAVLVEGYFDCVIPYQSGVKNIVASLGTALTEEQVKVLGRYTRKVIVSFDPDSAGTRAAIRSIDLFLSCGFQVNVLRLPEGEDPDSYILNHGASAYLEDLKQSQPYLDFLLDLFLSQERDPSSTKSKSSVAAKILPYLARVPNRIQRSEYISRIASRLRINQDALVFELRKYRRPATASPSAALSIQLSSDGMSLAEKSLLAAIFNQNDPKEIIGQLDPNLFQGLRTERLFRKIIELWNQNLEISVLNLSEVLEEQERNFLERLVVGDRDSFLEQDASSCISALRDQYLDRLSRQIQEEIEEEEKSGVSSPRLNDLLREKERINRERQIGTID